MEDSLKINKETMDILVTNVIPTTKYFESQFNHMQYQINEVKDNQKEFAKQVDKQINEVKDNQKEFAKQVDKRFEQVDKRFEQVDKRFEQVDNDIKEVKSEIIVLSNKVGDLSNNMEKSFAKMEIAIKDNIMDRDRYYDNKFNNLRMFNLAIAVSLVGMFLKFSNFI